MPRSFNKTLLFIKSIVVLATAGVLGAQDTSATVSGQVRDITSAVIPWTDAELTLEDPPYTRFTVRTDNEGRFKFTVLPPGTYTLKLSQQGFSSLTVKAIGLANAEQKGLPPLRLNIGFCGGPPVPEFLELRRTEHSGGNLSGLVLRDENHAIARATVTLICASGKVCGATKTDANGGFLFFYVSPRDDYVIRVTHPGYYASGGAGYQVQTGYDATYRPLMMDSRLRPKPPLSLCE